MKVTIGCPKGKYDQNMRIRCSASGTLCAHQYWCSCEGRCKLRDGHEKCPGRTMPDKDGRTEA